MSRLPWWRLVAGIFVLAGLGYIGANLAPIYWRNLKLQQFVEAAAQAPDNQHASEDLVRVQVLEKAHSLGLPVNFDNVKVLRTDGGVRIDVRYVAPVDLPLYRVNLHFYPGAGR